MKSHPSQAAGMNLGFLNLPRASCVGLFRLYDVPCKAQMHQCIAVAASGLSASWQLSMGMKVSMP